MGEPNLEDQGEALCPERTAVIRSEDQDVVGPQALGLERFLLAEASLDQLLQQVVGLARQTVGGADSVTLSLNRGKGYETPTATDGLGLELDLEQYKLEEGPCVNALKTHELTCFRVAESEPFPRFAEAATSKFVTAVLSTPLHAGGQGIGALNMYSGTVDEYPEEQIETARLFAEQASVILANGLAYNTSINLNTRLQEALLSRDIIGQAKGLVMARENCAGEEAFGRLRVLSQSQNRKLREVAADLVAEHEKAAGRPA